MATIFPFTTRRRERDDETDAARFGRLKECIIRIAAEIESEKSGLEARYRRETADAGFLLQALSNGDAPAHSATRAEHLTASILRCEQRLTALSRQAGLMRELRLRVEGFHSSQGIEAMPHKSRDTTV